jgi:hypothetical protein
LSREKCKSKRDDLEHMLQGSSSAWGWAEEEWPKTHVLWHQGRQEESTTLPFSSWDAAKTWSPFTCQTPRTFVMKFWEEREVEGDGHLERAGGLSEGKRIFRRDNGA